MRSLFWRYFLTQWMALVLLVAVTVVLTAVVGVKRTQALHEFEPGSLARAAHEIAARGGEEGLKQWVRSIDRRQVALTIHLLRPDDHTDILGQTVHPRVLNSLARSINRQTEASLPPQPGEAVSWWQSHRLQMPDGKQLQLVFLPYDNSQWDMLSVSFMPYILLALALLVTLPLCWVMTRHVTAPIGQLSAATRRLAAGHLDARTPPQASRRRDVLGQLARNFNTMAERIETQVQVREHLLRHIAHELRSPLTRLQIAVELATRQDQRLPVQLNRIVRESERLETLLRHTLELARVSDLSAPAAPVDLADLVDEVVDDARFEANEADGRVQWQRPLEAVWVPGDPAGLRSAVDNVVRNALRYSDPGAPVRVVLRAVEGWAVVEVTDGGPGVPEDELPYIFEPFHRGSLHSQQVEGSGLGLSIARASVQAHGGDIRAMRLPDGGFQVRLDVPLAPAAS